MKTTEKYLRQYIRETLVSEGPIDWLKKKASTEYDEAKFRTVWKAELLATLNPGTKALVKEIDITGKKGERIAKAWVAVGHEKFVKGAKDLRGKQRNYFMMYVNAIGYGGTKWAKPENLGQVIDDLFDKESDLYKKTEETTGKKLKKLWNKYFG